MPEEVVKVERDKEKSLKAPKKHKTVLNKVVIRRLPPNFTEEQFLISIQPTKVDDFYFVKADLSLGVEATSRAYIEMKSQDEIFLFKDKFDGYVFLDPVRGTEYPAVVEYASFQGLLKSRARKDKHVATIENEQHFQTFIENLKKAEDNENQKSEGKLEFTFQLKDDKKITSTPLLEFLAAAKEEKREAKKKKIDDKKKQRDEEKQRKKKEVAKNVPEPIKESKEEIVYNDGVVVRTVPSRLGRNENKNAKKEVDKEAYEKERREKREEKKKLNRERDEKRRQERDQQRTKEREAREKANAEKKPEIQQAQAVAPEESIKPQKRDETSSKPSQQPQKREIKRYSELRKARQEKSSGDPTKDENEELPATSEREKNDKESGEPVAEDSRWKKIQEAREKRAQHKEQLKKEKDSKKSNATNKSENQSQENPPKEKLEEKPKQANDEDPKWKRIQEMREKRAREKEDRAQREREERAARQIRNKDRPSMQIYRPKRVVDGKGDGGSNERSSDEKSEKSTRRRSDSIKSEKRERYRKNSRDERRKKGFGKRGSSNDDESVGVTDDKEQEGTEEVNTNDENLKHEDELEIQHDDNDKIIDDKTECVDKAEDIDKINTVGKADEVVGKLTLDEPSTSDKEQDEKDSIKAENVNETVTQSENA